MIVGSTCGPSIRRVAPGLRVGLACALAIVLCMATSSARAESQFGSYGSEAGQSIEPNGIAIDQSSGDVYLLDTNNNRVEKFTKDGTFLLAWGWGVAGSATQTLQTCTATTGCFGGSRGSGPGQLAFAEGIAVDNDPSSLSYHDVYVVEIFNRRVEKFSPTGKLLLTLGGQVNATAHERGETADENVCPIKPGDKCGSGVPGTGNGQFEFRVEGNFIAVGPTGIVYVGDRDRIQELSPDGSYLSQVRLSPNLEGEGEAGGTIAIAVDSNGDIYAIRNGVRGVRKYTPQGELIETLDEEAQPENNESPTPALALGPEGQVFVDYNEGGQHHIVEYDSVGAELVSFDEGMPDGLHGIAYGDSDGKLYIVNTGSTSADVRVVTPPSLSGIAFSSFNVLPWLLAR